MNLSLLGKLYIKDITERDRGLRRVSMVLVREKNGFSVIQLLKGKRERWWEVYGVRAGREGWVLGLGG